MNPLKAIFGAARRLCRQWRVMALLSIVYGALLGVLWLFVATREATAWQVLLTLIFAALAPALFFILQSMIVGYARGESSTLVLLRHSLRDSCRLALVSVPLILAALLFVYLLNKLQPYAVHIAPAQTASEAWPVESSASEPAPLQWSLLTLASVRLLFFGVILPLAAAHVWGAALRDGWLPALRKVPRSLPRVFAPGAVLTYAIGLALFGLIPYALLFKHTPAAGASMAFGLLVARLALIFLFTLCGWTLTLDALAGACELKAPQGEAATS